MADAWSLSSTVDAFHWRGESRRTGPAPPPPTNRGRGEIIFTVWQGQKFTHLLWLDSRNSAPDQRLKRNAGRSCAKLLLALSRLAAGSWQALAQNSPEPSASSTDRAADGTHLSADDILIYLSLTDGAMP